MNLTYEQLSILVNETERVLMEEALMEDFFLRLMVQDYMQDMSEDEMCEVLADPRDDTYEERLTEVLGFNPYDAENTNV